MLLALPKPNPYDNDNDKYEMNYDNNCRAIVPGCLLYLPYYCLSYDRELI